MTNSYADNCFLGRLALRKKRKKEFKTSVKEVGLDPEAHKNKLPKHLLLDIFRLQIRYLEELIPKPQEKNKE
jgi:hypothetical protein